MTRDERIAKIRGGRWIRYDRAEAINGRLEDLLQRAKSHRMPNVLLVDDTNNDKTALVNRFLAQRQPQAATTGRRRVFRSFPFRHRRWPMNARRFYQAIVSKVFAPFRPSRTAANLQFETVQLLASVGVKMLTSTMLAPE